MKWLKQVGDKARYFLIDLLKDKEVTESDSDKQVSATPISRQPGLNCPQCGLKMSITIDMLLSRVPIECPSCGLKLSIEKEDSKPALESLGKLDKALREAEKANRSL